MQPEGNGRSSYLRLIVYDQVWNFSVPKSKLQVTKVVCVSVGPVQAVAQQEPVASKLRAGTRHASSAPREEP
jgi:hypothetical protein